MASTVDIISYGKSKPGSGSSGGGVIKNVINSFQEHTTLADKLARKRKIWGHDFDGTKDVEGDFTAQGDWLVKSPVDPSSLVRYQYSKGAGINNRFIGRKTEFDIHDGSLNISESTSNDKLSLGPDYVVASDDLLIKAKELTLQADKMNQVYEEGHLDLGIKGDLKAGTVFTNNIYDDGGGQIYVGSPLLLDGGLDLNGDLTVKDLYSNNITNRDDLRTRNLTVTGTATFFDLVIAEVQAVGGQIILSAADFRIDDVAEGRTNVKNEHQFSVIGNGWIDGYYKTKYIYQVNEDSDGQKIECKWKPYDQIICYTANVSGDSALEARSWWTLVLDVQTDVERLIGNELKHCHRLEIVEAISQAEYTTGGIVPETDGVWCNPSWGVVSPTVGDDCALLGSNNVERQNAIILSAYDTFDVRLKAPCIAQYTHIVGYELPEPITYFAKNGNKITGNFVNQSGESMEDYLKDVLAGNQTYMHRAWSDSADGAENFTKVKIREYAYEGLCSNMTASDEELVYSDYLWMPANTMNKLLPTRERLYLASDDNLYLDVEYLTTNWSSGSEYTISAEIFTYGGAVTTRRITDYTNDGRRLRYCGIVQKGWSGITNHSMQYCQAVVYLKDRADKVIDSRIVAMSMDAGAVLSITDSIRQRVSDAEGNIATVVLTSRQLLTRITSLESSLQLALTDDSANLRIDDIEGRLNDLKITVSGLTATLSEEPEQYDDNWIRERLATFQATIDGLSATFEEIKTGIYDDSWIVTKFASYDASIDGLRATIKSIEQNGYDDSSITQRISDFQVTLDGLTYKVEQLTGNGDGGEYESGELAVLSNQIYARVTNNLKTTGIDIESGHIEIKADNTDFIGNINVYKSNESGITVFDDTDSPCINIQPHSIGTFSDFTPFAYVNYFTQLYTNGETGYSFVTEVQNIGQAAKGVTISILRVSSYVRALIKNNQNSDTTQFFPTSISGKAQIRYASTSTGSKEIVKELSFSVSSHTNGTFLYNNSLQYTTNWDGWYSVNFIIDGYGSVPDGRTGWCQISAPIQHETAHSTMLGKDGMYVNTAANKSLWCGNDGVVVRQGNQMIKVSEGGIFRGFPQGAYRPGSSPMEYVQAWYSIYNYVPLTDSMNYQMIGTYMKVPSINENKWCILIDPMTVNGDFNVTGPVMDNSYNDQETWILLPKTHWTSNGVSYALPAGWRIRIINGILSRSRGLYVSTQELSNMGGYDSNNVIYDSNRNGNRYTDLNGAESEDIFVWDGYFWRQMLDTQ